jgi:hypothetical protein
MFRNIKKLFMIEMLTIIGFVLFATLSVFGAINMFIQIKRLPKNED